MKSAKPSYILSVLSTNAHVAGAKAKYLNRITRISLKSQYIRMNQKCPVCGQPTEIEVGFTMVRVM